MLMRSAGTPLQMIRAPERVATKMTAWSTGVRYVKKGNWATYTSYAGSEKTVQLLAGQTLVAGDVTFSANNGGTVTITIVLNEGWRFALNEVGKDSNGFPIFDNNIKVQNYIGQPAAINPAPGLFLYKFFASGQDKQIAVPFGDHFGVHVDVERVVDCPE